MLGSLFDAAVRFASNPDVWGWVGWIGQTIFGARFAVQWIATERARRVVVPVFFWYLSIVGGLFSLVYAIHIGSGPFILGQSMGTIVYVRNLMLHYDKKQSGATA